MSIGNFLNKGENQPKLLLFEERCLEFDPVGHIRDFEFFS